MLLAHTIRTRYSYPSLLPFPCFALDQICESASLPKGGTRSKTPFTTMATNQNSSGAIFPDNCDRPKQLKEFDESKLGVKGLVDSGITQLPSIFRYPPESLSDLKPSSDDNGHHELIPVIDLSSPRPTVVEQIRSASASLGFFQIVNHSVPVALLDRLISSIKEFNELPAEMKSRYYTRHMSTGVSFFSNVDLFVSKAASWRDTLQVRLGPVLADLDHIPECCRDAVIEWDQEVKKLGEELSGILCEGLGLVSNRFKDMSCLESKVMVAHYYPCCPQPDQTLGISSHTDPGLITVLLQNQVGGLQVKYGQKWIPVKPVHGALVINIGDILQILSNDKYKSVDHRVLANSLHEPRVSIATFFNSSMRENLYGPLPELVSSEKPALYRQFTFADFMKRFFTKDLEDKSLIDFYRLH